MVGNRERAYSCVEGFGGLELGALEDVVDRGTNGALHNRVLEEEEGRSETCPYRDCYLDQVRRVSGVSQYQES